MTKLAFIGLSIIGALNAVVRGAPSGFPTQREDPRMLKGCFRPTTRVLLEDFTEKEIQHVENGDVVVSFNEETNEVSTAQVIDVLRYKRKEFINLEFFLGNGEKRVVQSTPDHPFWSKRSQQMVSLVPRQTRELYELDTFEMLELNEILEDSEGHGVMANITNIFVTDEEEEVITLRLEKDHWFFVEGIRTHNKGGGGGCFVGSTHVTMGNLESKEIRDIRPGDVVQSWNEETDSLTTSKVKTLIQYERQDFVEIGVTRSDGKFSMSTSIVATPDHPFYDPVQKKLISLQPGKTDALYELGREIGMFNRSMQALQDLDGATVTGSILKEFVVETSEPVFTLALENDHWFFAENILSHNKGAGGSGGGWSGGSGSGGGIGGGGSWGGTGGGGRYGTSTGIGGGTLYTSRNYHFIVIVNPYNSYYYHSPTCRANPSAYGCSQGQDDIVCGCTEDQFVGMDGVVEVGTNPKSSKNAWGYNYCQSTEQEPIGICVPNSSPSECVPPNPLLKPSDAGFIQVQHFIDKFCRTEFDTCQNETACADEMVINEASYYRSNATTSNNTNYQNLATCMETNLKICECIWPVCDEEEGMAGWAIFLIVFGILAFLCCWCAGREYWMSCFKCPSCDCCTARKVRKCMASHSDSLVQTTANEMYNQGHADYIEGFICDKCEASFGPYIPFSRCHLCSLDFCRSCKPAVQEAMPVDERDIQPSYISEPGPTQLQSTPSSSDPVHQCLANQQHTASLHETTAGEFYKATGDQSYKTGFICDYCHGLFKPDLPMNRCEICRIDFCTGCRPKLAFANQFEVSMAYPVAESQDIKLA